MQNDVIIIGSGLGGLECANLLAARGLRVLVLECERQPGGCMQSFVRHGFHFDTGLHYIGGLGLGEPLQMPFHVLGLDTLPWHRLDIDGFDIITLGDRTFRLAQGFDNFIDTLAADFPQERAGLEQYVKALQQSDREQWDSLDPDSDNNPLFSPSFTTGAWEYLNTIIHDPHLVDVLSGNAIRMELSRDTLPLFVFAHTNSSFIQSSWRLRGDGNVLVRALVDKLRQQGGNVICRAQVDELVIRDGKVVAAHCTDGTEYKASTFISDVHPAQTFAWVKAPHVLRPVVRHRVNAMKNTRGMLTVQLLLKADTLPYFNHNHFVYSKGVSPWDLPLADGSVGGVMVSCRVPEDGSSYTRQVDLLTPMSIDACKPWLDTTVGQRGDDYKRFKDAKANECIALAERVVPGLRDAIEAQYVSTPLTWRDYTLTPDGSAFGTRKDYRSPLLTTFSPRTAIPNLFLTGQSVMLQGVQGVTMTAMQTIKTAGPR